MTTWEIRETAYNMPVAFAQLQRIEADTSEAALADYHSQLEKMMQASENEIEQDLLVDLRAANVQAIEVEEMSVPVAREPRRLVGTSAAIIPTAGDGYDFMNTNTALGWKAVPAWGKDGWDMGRWPLVCVMTNDDFVRPRTLVYIEGDVEVLEFATTAEREMYLNDLSEQFWRSGDADGPNDLAAFVQGSLPDRYKGPPQVFAPAVTAAAHVAVQPSVAPLVER